MRRLPKLSLLIGLTILLVFAIGAIAYAGPVYTMPGVPQTVGIPDKPYASYTEAECRNCHGQNLGTANLHHLTPTALNTTDPAQGCVACHTVVNGAVSTPIVRDCLTCHKDSWHHKQQNALGGNCTFCHNPNLLKDQGTGFLDPPKYAPSLVTPDPHDCANCHNEFNPAWDPNNWNSGQQDPNEVSHHSAFQTTLSQQCGWCHDQNVPAQVEAPIRMCESCHTIATLHNIAGHTVDNNKCVGCHGDYMDGTQIPAKPTVIAFINNIDKSYGEKFSYVIVNGTNFGLSTDTGSVYLKITDALGTVRSYLAPATIWGDNQIKVMVPEAPAGNYDLVVTTTAGTSNAVKFSVVNSPTITSITPTMALAGATVTINGTDFTMGTPVVNFVATGKSYTFNPQVISGTQLKVTLPVDIPMGKYGVTVTTNVGTTNTVYFTVADTPEMTALTPNYGVAGKTIVITGKNLTLGSKPTVKFGATAGVVGSYTATKVYVKVPAIPAGNVDVILNNGWADSNALPFTVQ